MGYTRCKICGITNPLDARLASDFGADALGFIFARSKRQVDTGKVREIFKVIPPFVSKVLVVRNMSKSEIDRILSAISFDIIQFHGDETEDFCLSFRPLGIIKAFSIREEKDLEEMKLYPNLSCFLLDSYSKTGGGSGVSFNWDFANRAKQIVHRDAKIILAGGLNLDNITMAIDKVKPYAVDVASGVENDFGIKDHAKLKEFIEKVKKN